MIQEVRKVVKEQKTIEGMDESFELASEPMLSAIDGTGAGSLPPPIDSEVRQDSLTFTERSIIVRNYDAPTGTGPPVPKPTAIRWQDQVEHQSDGPSAILRRNISGDEEPYEATSSSSSSLLKKSNIDHHRPYHQYPPHHHQYHQGQIHHAQRGASGALKQPPSSTVSSSITTATTAGTTLPTSACPPPSSITTTATTAPKGAIKVNLEDLERAIKEFMYLSEAWSIAHQSAIACSHSSPIR